MKFRFRVLLLALVIGLILLTVATVGVASFLNSRSAAEEMAGQILEQTSLRVDQQVDKLLGEATGQTALTLRMLQSGQLRSRDFPKVVAYWKEALAVSPAVASLYLGLADTGECVGVSRLKGAGSRSGRVPGTPPAGWSSGSSGSKTTRASRTFSTRRRSRPTSAGGRGSWRPSARGGACGPTRSSSSASKDCKPSLA
jgi:hypothetical protein